DVDSSDGTATVENHGAIYALADTADAIGIYAYGVEGASVTNDADITVVSTAGTSWYVSGIYANSEADTTVDNSGDVSAGAYNQDAIGISAYGSDSASVTNSGLAHADSWYGDATGIYAASWDGSSSVDNSGTVEAFSLVGTG